MSLCSRCRLFFFQIDAVPSIQYFLQKRNYAGPNLGLGKKGNLGKKIGTATKKKLLPVETDVNKLLTYVCGSNIYKEGEDIKIKSDEEYPDWLWTIRTGPAPPLEEMDPNTKAYWRRIRRMGLNRNNKLASLKKF